MRNASVTTGATFQSRLLEKNKAEKSRKSDKVGQVRIGV